MEQTFKKSIAEMIDYMSNNGLKIKPLPKVKICKDIHEGPACLHPTGHYEPANQTITLQVNGRHEKDVLKTLAHEMIHHEQNLRGDLDESKMGAADEGYAQTNKHLREMEREAYERSAMLFRDWTDNKKSLDEKLVFYKDKEGKLRRFDTDKSKNKKYN
tara:strand:- start:1366 stop:1842 length:477 start_codon:yes stop_codon:yes gene_type:complete